MSRYRTDTINAYSPHNHSATRSVHIGDFRCSNDVLALHSRLVTFVRKVELFAQAGGHRGAHITHEARFALECIASVQLGNGHLVILVKEAAPAELDTFFEQINTLIEKEMLDLANRKAESEAKLRPQ